MVKGLYQRVVLGISVVILLSILFGCAGPSLPIDRPVDFEITWAEGGGMLMSGDRAVISATKGTRTFDEVVDGSVQERVVEFVPTVAELDMLYSVLYTHGVDAMFQSSTMVYDADNTMIGMSWGKNDVNVSAIHVFFFAKDGFWKAHDAIGKYLNEKAP